MVYHIPRLNGGQARETGLNIRDLWNFLVEFRNSLARRHAGHRGRRVHAANNVARPVHPSLHSTGPAFLSGQFNISAGPLFSSFLHDAPALIIAKKSADLSTLTNWLNDFGHEACFARDLGLAAKDLVKHRLNYSMLFVDIDSFDGICFAIDDLRLIRNAAPELPIVVLTRDVASDDFSTARLAITDVTLRHPLRVSTLEVAVIEAFRNNLQWQNRLTGMAEGQHPAR